MYKIIYKAWKDEEAEQHFKYYVMKLKKFLWWSYWGYVKESHCYGMDCYTENMSFGSEYEARAFIARDKRELEEKAEIIVP